MKRLLIILMLGMFSLGCLSVDVYHNSEQTSNTTAKAGKVETVNEMLQESDTAVNAERKTDVEPNTDLDAGVNLNSPNSNATGEDGGGGD